MLAAYLIDPAESRYVLEEVLDRYAHLTLATSDGGAAEGELSLGEEADPSLAGRRSAGTRRRPAG